jgi:hypothetical protein
MCYDYNQFDVDKVIYAQDCEFYRYQDRLRWSRFQTIIVIEGAWLAVVFGTLDLPLLGSLGQLAITIFGFMIITFLCLLSLKDEIDSNRHMDRLSHFERELWNRPLLSYARTPTHDTLGDIILYPLRLILPSGSTLTVFTVGIIVLFNLGVVWKNGGSRWSLASFFVIGFFGVMYSLIQLRRRKRKEPVTDEQPH